MGFSVNSIKTQNCDKGIKDFEKKNVNRQVLGETGKESRKNKQINSGGVFFVLLFLGEGDYGIFLVRTSDIFLCLVVLLCTLCIGRKCRGPKEEKRCEI